MIQIHTHKNNGVVYRCNVEFYDYKVFINVIVAVYRIKNLYRLHCCVVFLLFEICIKSAFKCYHKADIAIDE